jgi:hypothetical protein
MALDPSEFSTRDLFFAAWLLCGRVNYRKTSLEFRRVESIPGTRSGKVFIFSDANGEIPELKVKYEKTNPVMRLHTLRHAFNFLYRRLNEGGGAR